MALVLKDRVRESSTTSGTGSITLAGAYTGYQTFDSVVANGSTVYYTIHNTTSPNDGEWEVGVGTFTSPSTLSRDTVLSSSAGGTTKVSFSGSSVLEVFITQPAEQAVYINEATGVVEAFGNGTNTISFTDINTANLTANTVTLTAGTISTNAANATDIVNKQYVDGIVAAGVHYHEPVRVESPIALSPVTYNNGSSGVGATLTNAGTQVALVIDGVTVSVNDRVLIYTQTDQTQNGVYVVTDTGSGSTNWVLTRATDADSYVIDSPTGLSEGSTFFVSSGNTGAGETYTCNTPGVITFGTTNITFAQISSAQIYSAGTGLSLTNTTFSISNTTVVTGLYGDSANVAVIEVNPQGQLTSASNAAINVSNITVGTLDNARTTANASNGANTIVLRDSTGSFNANTVTATTGNFTSITANAAGLTDINASNITSGTIANDRTTGNTANSASTLVLRDVDGNFGSNVISASLFSGDGSGINAINASNISSGTIANARTTAASANGASTIVLRDSGGSFDANTVNAVSLIGNASQVTAINASNISSGTIANARTTADSANGASTIVLRGASGEFAAGAITGTLFTGNGSAISAINASNISTGTIDNARTTAASANGASTIVARDAGGNFAANTVTATNFSGGGGSISAINASNISTGTIANARTTASDANGASTIVARDASGNFSGNTINGQTIRLQDGSTTVGVYLKQKTLSGTGTDNTPVLFSESGLGINFAVNGSATTVGNISTAGVLTINGSGINSINASNLSSGTVASARISGSYTGITGVGTLSAGTWNATTIAIANGGTGATTAANALTNLGAYAASNPSGYVTTAGARSALSFTAGSGAYNSTTGVITIPTNTNQLTNGAGFTTNTGTVTSVASGAGMNFSTITSSGTVAMGTPSTLTNSTTNSASGTTHTHELSGELVETTTGSAPYYGARAWVCIVGSNGSAAASVNVSSTSRFNVGRYSINLSTALVDTNYVVQATAKANQDTLSGSGEFFGYTRTTSNIQVSCGNQNNYIDFTFVNVSIYR